MHSKTVLPILFFTLVVDAVSFGIIIPIIPSVLTDPTSPSFILHGYSQQGQLFMAGLLTAIFGIMQFFAAPVLGEFSDIYGRKKLLSAGIVALALSQLLFGISLQAGSLVFLFVSRIIAGLSAANFSIAQAVIADVTEAKDRAKNFGLIGAAFGIGFIVGPLLSGWIVHLFGVSAPFWFATALGLINALSVTLFLPETRKHIARESKKFTIFKGVYNVRSAIKDVNARPLYGANFLYFSGFSFFVSFSGIYLVSTFGLSEAGVGTFFGVVGLWIVVTQGILLRIVSKHFNERQILRFSMLSMATGLFLFTFMPSMGLVYALMPVIAIGNGLSIANMNALISKSVSAEKQGVALGINGSLAALGNSVIPIAAGAASGLLATSAPFIIGAVFVLFAWAVLFARPMRS